MMDAVSRSFGKYEGLGNDFVVVEAPSRASAASFSTEEAVRLCDRHRGIGADGVLVVSPAEQPGTLGAMRVINRDGSVPEMCGNGLRCVALHLALERGLTTLEGVVLTDAGPRAVTVVRDGPSADVTVDMGLARVDPDRELHVEGERVRVVPVDVGNPHAVLWPVAARHDRALIERLGPALERHAAFPRGTNVELVSHEAGALRVTVWERGAGFTEACGTGACAAVAALAARGEVAVADPVSVRLPGGELTVSLAGDRVTMRGPARRVFVGTLP